MAFDSSPSRRKFLHGASAFGAAAAASSGSLAVAQAPPAAADLKLGVASYSFREFSRRMTIAMTKKLQTPYINVKEFHMLYRSTPKEIDAAKRDFERAGLIITGGGTITLNKADEADIRFYFEYAKACGMPMMVIAPTAETVPMIEKFVKEYNIKCAIHNHGPEDKHFPTPESALKLIRNMDPRMGLCIDVGHTTRTGTDVVKSIRDAGPRLLDMHIKDLKNLMDKDSQCDVGDGVMPIVAIFKELKKMNYQGHVMLEYEINAEDPLPGMIKSFAYMRGVLAGLRG